MQLTVLLTWAAAKDLDLKETIVETPLDTCTGHLICRPIVIAPILRAGLGMAEAMLMVLPEARIGHIGMYRDEATLEPVSYYFRAPPGLSDADVFIVDPMIATGNSAIDAAGKLKRSGAKRLRFMALLGCTSGIERFLNAHPDVSVFVAALDGRLNELGYIVPGLGDAGDRYFGT